MSSPHTRGSSRWRPPSAPRQLVVPAHAGVIPGVGTRGSGAGSRPRTRGGHPLAATQPRTPAGSSPHTRGSSYYGPTRTSLRTVVPAHAGVIRASGGPRPCAQSRPRTRGGHPLGMGGAHRQRRSSPHTRGSSGPSGSKPGRRPVVPAHAGVIPGTMAPMSARTWSSPHTRGSSPGRSATWGWAGVVPAHAGVIPGTGRPRRDPRRRPRTRGGHPALGVTDTFIVMSSPHTRGSSSAGAVGRHSASVVPAHAGVIPRCTSFVPSYSSRPRTRGGHPGRSAVCMVGFRSSPHTRGSSVQGSFTNAGNLVVPAHAGVIPPVPGAPDRPARRPRTRGGHPAYTSWLNSLAVSSPHTRGSSGAGDDGQIMGHVVPAHAGVIRRHPVRGADLAGRPRTRGGHPHPQCGAAPRPPSSPHTRGSSALSVPIDNLRGVVPAHAGVIPGHRRPRAGPPGRPRTRGGHPVTTEPAAGDWKSSPHTRGSSAVPGGGWP